MPAFNERYFFFAGRVLLAMLFIIAGIMKVTTYSFYVGYFEKLGIPLPSVAVPAALIFEIGGGIAFIAGWQTRILSIALALFTLVSALFAHQFWNAEQAQFAGQVFNFFKNVAIVGGFILVAIRKPE